MQGFVKITLFFLAFLITAMSSIISLSDEINYNKIAEDLNCATILQHPEFAANYAAIGMVVFNGFDKEEKLTKAKKNQIILIGQKLLLECELCEHRTSFTEVWNRCCSEDKQLDSNEPERQKDKAEHDPSSEEHGTFVVRVLSGGIVNVEVDNYVVKIQKEMNLNGEYKIGLVQVQKGSGNFLGETARFHEMKYGYYKIECYGFNNYNKKLFHVRWNNIKFNCNYMEIQISLSGMDPQTICY